MKPFNPSDYIGTTCHNCGLLFPNHAPDCLLVYVGPPLTGESAAFDDERDDYTAPGHTAPIGGFVTKEQMESFVANGRRIGAITMLPSAGDVAGCQNCEQLRAELELLKAGTCQHTFELQSLRMALANAQVENDNLRAELNALNSGPRMTDADWADLIATAGALEVPAVARDAH